MTGPPFSLSVGRRPESKAQCSPDALIRRGVAYRDESLDGLLATDDGKVIHLALRSAQGEPRVLTLLGVEAFCADAFRQGNIILDIRGLPAQRVYEEEELARRIAERLGLDPQKPRAESLVFHLSSSYGAEIIAVCGAVEISEVGAKLELTR